MDCFFSLVAISFIILVCEIKYLLGFHNNIPKVAIFYVYFDVQVSSFIIRLKNYSFIWMIKRVRYVAPNSFKITNIYQVPIVNSEIELFLLLSRWGTFKNKFLVCVSWCYGLYVLLNM